MSPPLDLCVATSLIEGGRVDSASTISPMYEMVLDKTSARGERAPRQVMFSVYVPVTVRHLRVRASGFHHVAPGDPRGRAAGFHPIAPGDLRNAAVGAVQV